MVNKNPLNKDELDRQEIEPKRIEPQLISEKFTPEEQKKIVLMILDDIEVGREASASWVTKKQRDLQHLNCEKPSEIEGITKEAWQSDRNLGLAAGIHDIFQATLLATCWNPDTIHMKASEQNDVDNRDASEKFMKWVVSSSEADLDKEVDDHINHRVGLGFSLFKIFWEVKYEWVDKRMPKVSEDNDKRITGYDIVTEERRTERGRMVNVDHLDDILIPTFGKNVQDLRFFIEILHGITDSDLEDLSDRGIIMNYKDGKFIGLSQTESGALSAIDERDLGTVKTTAQSADSEKRNEPKDIYEWYGTIFKDKKKEKYRIWIEPQTQTFLAGIPLRKINRAGKLPYVGGPLRRRPGFLRGGSLTTLIAPIINALNNAFNQTSDFQYFENCPFGFYDKNQDEMKGGIHEVVPMKMFPIDGNPNDKIFFPNLSRSLSWSYQFFQFCLEMIERLTGAASYFLTSNQPEATATRDNIVEEKGQVKFGLWVKRIQSDISEGLNMLFQMYQDWAPSDLATRVIGDDGKSIIKNLSIDSIKGAKDVYMTPDITSGSKAYEKQVAMMATQAANQGCLWLDPRLNPRGNWLLWKDYFKKQGIQNPEHFMPPQPKDAMDYSKEAEAHFDQMKQGDKPEPPDADNPQIVECFVTMQRLNDTRRQELDEEYRANMDHYLFVAYRNYMKFTMKIAQEQQAMMIAHSAAGLLEKAGMGPGGKMGPTPPPAPITPPGGPGMPLNGAARPAGMF